MSRLMIKGNQASGIYGNATQVKINEIEGMTAANVQEALVATNNSLTQKTSGKFILPNGLKIQWGTTEVVNIPANSDGTLVQTVQYSEPYDIVCSVNVTNVNGVPVFPITYNNTNNGFSIYGVNPKSAVYAIRCTWVSIGY